MREIEGAHPRSPHDKRDEIELFIRDAYAAGCQAAQERSLFTAMEYAAREAPKLRAVIAQQPEGPSIVTERTLLLGKVLGRYVDRMIDPTQDDPLEKIVNELLTALRDSMNDSPAK